MKQTGIRITKNRLILDKAPKTDKVGGLGMFIPKLELETTTGFLSGDLHAGQRKYNLPPNVKGKDIGSVWIV